ncbi:MAG: iron-sulfur cluster assembly protein [Candidatus Bathyarchaeia archaeon]
MDKSTVMEVLRKVHDPEYPMSVVDLKIVNEEDISFDGEKIKILFTPTSPFCPMGGIIGAMIKYALEKETGKTVEISLKPGTHAQEKMLNEIFSDSKQYDDAIDRLRKAGILERCVTL